jgi:hypothetical protein
VACGGILRTIPMRLTILTVKKDGDDGLVVSFSDGTDAGYVVEELLKLRPKRRSGVVALSPAIAPEDGRD